MSVGKVKHSGPCRRCGVVRPIFTRGLCVRCHSRCRRDGTLQNYPEYPAGNVRDEDTAGFCACEEPDFQPVVMWGTVRVLDIVECTKCLRPPSPSGEHGNQGTKEPRNS